MLIVLEFSGQCLQAKLEGCKLLPFLQPYRALEIAERLVDDNTGRVQEQRGEDEHACWEVRVQCHSPQACIAVQVCTYTERVSETRRGGRGDWIEVCDFLFPP